jgi:hypothetical protein
MAGKLCWLGNQALGRPAPHRSLLRTLKAAAPGSCGAGVTKNRGRLLTVPVCPGLQLGQLVVAAGFDQRSDALVAEEPSDEAGQDRGSAGAPRPATLTCLGMQKWPFGERPSRNCRRVSESYVWRLAETARAKWRGGGLWGKCAFYIVFWRLRWTRMMIKGGGTRGKDRICT